MKLFPSYRDTPQSSSIKYHALRYSSEIDKEDKEAYTRTTPTRRNSACLRIIYCSVILWNVFLLALTTYAIYNLRTSTRPSYSNDPGPLHLDCSCGSNLEEAQSLGCTFDVLSLSWLPAHCRDDELTYEFAHSGPGPNGEWEYWADGNASISMTIEEVGLLAFQEKGYVFSPLGFHVAHCSYYWRKEYRMRAKGLMMEGRYDKESHIEHCHSVFMSDTPKDKGMTRSLIRLGGEDFGGPDSENGHHHHHD